MSMKITAVMIAAFLPLALVSPASAQGAAFDVSGLYAAGSGSQSNTTFKTGAGPTGASQAHVTARTGLQIPGHLRVVSTLHLAPVFGMTGFDNVVGYGAYGGALAGGGNQYNPDNIDSPNLSDTYNSVASQQAIISQENNVEVQNGGYVLPSQQEQLGQGGGAIGQENGSQQTGAGF